MNPIVTSRSFRSALIFSIGYLLLTGCSEPNSSDNGKFADFVFINGKVYTGDTSKPWASSIAISGGKLIYVGDEVGLGKMIKLETQRYDLRGNIVLPGLHDRHVHALWGGLVYSGTDKSKCISLKG